jgi:hypothetical protein
MIFSQYKDLDSKDFLKSYLTINEIDIKKRLKYLRSEFPKRLVEKYYLQLGFTNFFMLAAH